VGVECTDGAVYVARLPDGPIVVLTETASLIWVTACSDEPGTVAERVAARVDRSVQEITPAVESFLADLVDRGLLRAVG
jgi:hypothetical protein